MNRTFGRTLAVLAGLVVSAASQAWEVAMDGQPFSDADSGYTIQYPAGWRWLKPARKSGDTFATLDGPQLQNISVEIRKHKKAFPTLKQEATPAMLPHELAEKLVAEENAVHQNVEILSNEPALVGGLPGFRLDLTHRVVTDTASLRYREIVLGTNTPRGVFIVHYRAPVLHYFERDFPTFEKSLASLMIEERAN